MTKTVLGVLVLAAAMAAEADAFEVRCTPQGREDGEVVGKCAKRIPADTAVVLHTLECRSPHAFVAKAPRPEAKWFRTSYFAEQERMRGGRLRLADDELVVTGRMRGARSFVVRNRSPFAVKLTYRVRCAT